MSILLGPFDKADKPSSEDVYNKNEFIVLGYQCRLYRNDDKANMENDEELLIPWMGDRSLMVDRYDVRNRFDDKSQFGLKSNLPQRYTEEEEEFERLLDEERYKAIDTDITEEELLREEEQKRMYEVMAPQGSYHAVDFSYNNVPEKEMDQQLVDQPQLEEHLSTTYVDNPDDGGEYERPFRLFLPPNIQTPFSQKLHAVIERTATFISRQGQQMEIIIKTKQRFNPSFSFLHHEDRLFPYYKLLFNNIKNGSYEPQPCKETEVSPKEQIALPNDKEITTDNDNINNPITGRDPSNQINDTTIPDEQDNSSGSSDEEFELHPILRAKLKPKDTQSRSNSETNSHSNSDNLNSDTAKFKSKTFKNIAYNINSAPIVTEESISNGIHPHTLAATTTVTKTESSDEARGGASITPGYTICHGYDPMMAYYQASKMYHTGAVPPPPDLQPVVDKTAEYVAKNGDKFEATVILKHISDTRFGFLNPWNQYNHYYKTKVAEYREAVKITQENAPKNMQKLNNLGNISFKMSAKVMTPPWSKGVNMSVVGGQDEVDDDSNNGGDEPPVAKKPKLTQEEIVMDNTVKHFLLTVKSSFN